MALPISVVKVYYGKPMLPEVKRVLTCLYEKDFELVDFQNVDCMPVDLIRLQASTSVPAPFFEDGPKFLFESRAICRYVSETYADRGNRYLLGRDLLDRVSIEQWLKSEEQSFDPPSRALVLHLAFSPQNNSYNGILEESERRLGKVLDVYNHRLGDSRYLAGDEFTLADLTHLPNSQYIFDHWGHLFEERENVKRWWEDVSKRPSWSKVVELERFEEEEDEEELTEEMEENSIGVIRPRCKMSLKAGIFQPIEAMQPVIPKAKFTMNKNVAGPSGSVQVTVPDQRAFTVSVPDHKVAQAETTRVQPHLTHHTEGPVADAEVTMEPTAFPSGTQISHTSHSDKANTEATRIESQSTKPVTVAKVTVEGSAIPPTDTQKTRTARTDKASTEPTRVVPQSTKPVTVAKVTVEGSDIPPTDTQKPHTARIDKASTEPTRVVPQSTKPVTVAKVTVEGYDIPPTDTQIHHTARIDKASTEPPRIAPQSTKPVTDAEAKVNKAFSPPTSTDMPPTHKTTNDWAKVTKKNTASQADETSSISSSRDLQFTQAPLPTSTNVQPTKPLPGGTQTPSTDKTTTKSITKDQGQILSTESKHGQAAEKRANEEDETEIKAYLAAKHKEWGDQWQNPQKFGEEQHSKDILAQKPQPLKTESTTPSTTPSSSITTSAETARQEPAPHEPTNIPAAKKPSESRNNTKQKDMTPPATQDPADKTPAASSTPSASTQESVLLSTGETRGGITDKTSNAPAPKPPKQAGSTATSQVTITKSQTTRQEPMTDISKTTPAKEPSISTVPVTQEEPSPAPTTTKTQDTAPKIIAQETTIPTAKQTSPSSAADTTSIIDSKTNKVSAESPTTTTPKPITEKANDVPAIEASKPTVPETHEETSRGAATKEPKEKEKASVNTETAFSSAYTKRSSSETIGKDQAPLATKQTPPIDATASQTTGKDQAPPVTKQKPLTDETAAETSEETSRGATTKEPREKVSPGTETASPWASTQKSFSEITGKDQAPSVTKQTPPANETSAETIRKEQAPPATKQTPPNKITSETTGTNETATESTQKDQDVPAETAPKTTRKDQPPLANKQIQSTDETTAETTEKDQAAPNTKQELPNNETAPKTTGKDQAPAATKQTPTTDEAAARNTDAPQSKTTSSATEKGIDLAKSSQADNQKEKSEKKQDFPSGTTSKAITSFPDNQKKNELSLDEKSSSLNKMTPASDGSSTEPDTTRKQNETLDEINTEQEKLDTNKPIQTIPQQNRTNDNENMRTVDESGKGRTKDEASSIQTTPKDVSTKGVSSAQTTSSDARNEDEKFSSSKESDPASDAKRTAPDTTPEQKETQNEKETNQNKASPDNKEVISLKEPSPEPRNEQNNKPDSTDNLGTSSKE